MLISHVDYFREDSPMKMRAGLFAALVVVSGLTMTGAAIAAPALPNSTLGPIGAPMVEQVQLYIGVPGVGVGVGPGPYYGPRRYYGGPYYRRRGYYGGPRYYRRHGYYGPRYHRRYRY